MSLNAVITPDPAQTLAKAVLNAGKQLGLTQSEVGKIIGRDRSRISQGLDPHSKAGELALLLVRCYRALFVLVGREGMNMRHWFGTHNNHLGGVPKELINNVQGLVDVTEYLDAVRGKI